MNEVFIHNHRFKVERGQEYFDNGVFTFVAEALMRNQKGQRRADGTYRTNFGPCVQIYAKIYEESNHNISLAMSRLLAVRKADVEMDRRLRKNQISFYRRHKNVFAAIARTYACFFNEYKGMRQECDEHYDDPHDKRDLRVQAYKDIIERGVYGDKLWLRYVIYKMKKNEWGKFGKVPRMIGNLRVPASLQGFRVTKLLKTAMSERPVEYLNGTIYFCASPTEESLQYVFDQLLNPSGSYFFVYFSDDACYAVRNPDGTISRYNLDISKCDASHGPAVFQACRDLTPNEANVDMQILIDQCKMPIRVYDLAGKKTFVQLRPFDPTLYSGSTITTVVNNTANLSIAIAIAELQARTPKQIIEAAESAGYIYTIDECTEFEDMQFLKHSPALDTDGAWRPLLNVGVLLRLSGRCKGDLPGRGPIKERAQAFQAGLLQGVYPYTSFPLIDNMKKSAKPTSNAKLLKAVTQYHDRELQYKVTKEKRETRYFTQQAVYKRYRLTQSEMDVLDDRLGGAAYSTFHSSDGSSKVLETDYGYLNPSS